MKNILLFFTMAAVMINFTLKDLSAQDGYELIWEDEFDGPELSIDYWDYQIGTGASEGLTNWGNNELQYYRSENVRLEDGIMYFDVKKETFGGKNYTSARIRTKGKLDFTYGKVEARIQIPYGQGIWSAFWMLPTDNEYGGWASSGEIDIVEVVNDATQIHGTLHYGGSWPNNQSKGNSRTIPSGRYSDDFHVYGIEWEEGEIRWYCDGEEFSRLTSWNSSGGAFPAPFDKDFHLLLNVAVGGNWPGSPNSATIFPQQMKVDWVRVYQKNNTTGVAEKAESVPHDFSLEQNYPNPFNPQTNISYRLEKPGHVNLTIYNVSGQVMETLVDEHQSLGKHTISWDATGLASGLYFYRITFGTFTQINKMAFIQ